MLVIGLTGGIGSGKSTVATLFLKKGIPIIDADEVARKVTSLGEPALQQISQLFGEQVLLPNGQLDRSALKKIVFANDALRKKLEGLLHPLIRAEIQSRIATLTTPYCIAMIPLLLETLPNPLINRVLVVDVAEDLQIVRTTLRDAISHEHVEAILKTQISRDKRLQLAHDIIINDGIFEDLITQVDKLHEQYLSLAGQSKPQK